MLTKNVLKRCGVVGLLVFVMLWTQIPVKAQEKSLREQLEEAKTAIAGQVWIIEQIKDNELGRLKAVYTNLEAINAEQAQTIKQIADNFFKITSELNEEIAFLEKINADTKKTLNQAVDNYFKVTGGLSDKLESLEAANTGQPSMISQITGPYYRLIKDLGENQEKGRTEERFLQLSLRLPLICFPWRVVWTNPIFSENKEIA